MPEGDAHHMGGTMRLGARCTAIALAYSDRDGKGWYSYWYWYLVRCDLR